MAQSPSFEWDRDVEKNGFIHGERYYLDPEHQNIPLNNANFRPPRPHVPLDYDIFIGLPSYRDGSRCGYTIWTAFSRALNASRLHIGVVDQIVSGDVECINEYCKLAKETWPDDLECRYKNQISIDLRDAKESTGPISARVALHNLIKEEEFCLVMDSHMQFIPDWDGYLVEDWKKTGNEMAVLSVYPTGYETIGPGLTQPVSQTRHNCYFAHDSLHTIPDFGAILIDDSQQPQMGAFIGAGFQFSKCHAQTRVPLDAKLKWVFLGEEFLRSMQLWTQGYDIYSPSRLGHVVFHDETPKSQTTRNGSYDDNESRVATYKTELEMSLNRMRSQLSIPYDGPVDLSDIDKYYPPKVRSLEKYLKFSGVSLTDLSLDTWPCKQLHWVPYDNPEPIQHFLPNYKMKNPVELLQKKAAVLNSRSDDRTWEILSEYYQAFALLVVAVGVSIFLVSRRKSRRTEKVYEVVPTEEDKA
ncbi:hypothetical protein THRCLA_03250 [Thraustotheca clavata]|uniref:GlcNac transferase n=1 Tax=Thraustotheca clavata TaxID=74557 RepID=A0A1W0A2M3_9STRA|nr:hypothetical protein THRCLA_03250 [Thraustotheca clavata]